MILTLFTTFFKIGLFTFGGGYGMISIVKDECVEKRKWIDDQEFVDLIAVAEATPGPIAINMATYVGYKLNKFLGAIVATIGVVLPSMIIIYIISLFLNTFLSIKVVAYAFSGIRVAVCLVIIRTAYKLIISEFKTSSQKFLTLVLFFIYTFIVMFFKINSIVVSSALLILFAIIIGVIISIWSLRRS